MLNRLILKVTKFQLPPPKRLGTVVKNILGGHHAPPPLSNRVKSYSKSQDHMTYSGKVIQTFLVLPHKSRFQTET